MRTVALEPTKEHIGVNDVVPGAVVTPMDAALKTNAKEYQVPLDEIPLGRMAKPEEIAGVALSRVFEAASYITGATYVIDGGMTKCVGKS